MFEILPTVPDGYLIADSPRTYEGTDYYTPEGQTTLVAITDTLGAWHHYTAYDDPTTPQRIPITWDNPSDLNVFLIAYNTPAQTGRYTCLSNEDWTTTHAHLIDYAGGPEQLTLTLATEAPAFTYRGSDQLWTPIAPDLPTCTTSATGRQFVTPPEIALHHGGALLAVDNINNTVRARNLAIRGNLTLPTITEELAKGSIGILDDTDHTWLIYRNSDGDGDFFGVELSPYPPT